ncbi:MAG: ABC transporter permease [Calditrichia bacterium]
MLNSIIQREWKQIFEKRVLYGILIFVPILLFVVLSLIYQQKVITDLPFAVVDRDNSQLSRLLIRSLDATRTLAVSHTVTDEEELRKLFWKGEIEGAVVIPAGLADDIKRGKSGSVVVYKNTANLIIGNLILKDALGAVRTISAGIQLKQQKARGLLSEQAMHQVVPIDLQANSLYNPAYNYINFLIPGLLAVMLQMIAMIAIAYSFSLEKTERGWAELMSLSKGRVWPVLLGKSLPHIFLNTASSLALVGILFPLYGIPVHGNLFMLTGFTILLIMASCATGMMLSTFFNDLMLASEAAVFLTTPAFIFSGYTFPVEAMPAIHQYYAALLPSTHFMTGFIKLYQMGTPLEMLWSETVILLGFTIIPLLIAWLIFRKRWGQKGKEKA